MIASEFIYDNIITGLTLNTPVYIGPSVDIETSYISVLDVGNQADPKYLRDVYTIDFVCRFRKHDYELGMNDMKTIKDGILGHPNIVDSDGNIWCRFLMSRGPRFVTTDDYGRSVFTMLFEVTVDSLNGVYRETIQ